MCDETAYAYTVACRYNLSKYQQAMFLTPKGYPMIDFGRYFSIASAEFTGVKLGDRGFRAFLTTEKYGEGDTAVQKVTDQVSMLCMPACPPRPTPARTPPHTSQRHSASPCSFSGS